jgi:hypothetical protein
VSQNSENIKNVREKKLKFVNAISSCLYDIKAYNLPKICSNYGLENGEESEAYSSKNNYIRSRIDHKSLEELISLAEKILHDYYDLELENLILLESESNLIKKITNLTLLDLFDYLDQISLYGRLNSEEFLLKIKESCMACSSEKVSLIPSLTWAKNYNKWSWFYTDSFNQWHFLDNSGLIKEILELNKLPQSKIFSFIELLVSPEVRREEDVKIVLENINKFISKDGFLLKQVYTISNKPIFKIRESSSKIISQSFGNNLDAKKEISSKFIIEHIDDCKKYIEQSKYYDAISDARSLVESVFEYILEEHNVSYNNCNGDLGKLFREIKKALNFEAQNLKTKVKDETLQEAFIKISGSLEQIVMSIGTISNKMSKRHSRSSESLEHHALLAVNCAYTVCNFVFDSYKYQKSKNL